MQNECPCSNAAAVPHGHAPEPAFWNARCAVQGTCDLAHNRADGIGVATKVRRLQGCRLEAPCRMHAMQRHGHGIHSVTPDISGLLLCAGLSIAVSLRSPIPASVGY